MRLRGRAPARPSVAALPGDGKSLAQFQQDDASCRQYAQAQIGNGTPGQAAQQSTVNGAVAEPCSVRRPAALIGAAAHNPGAGAAVGAGTGLVVGTAAGANNGAYAGAGLQQRYDNGYVQCMAANGNKVPMPVAAGYGSYPYPPPPPPYAYPGYYPGYYAGPTVGISVGGWRRWVGGTNPRRWRTGRRDADRPCRGSHAGEPVVRCECWGGSIRAAPISMGSPAASRTPGIGGRKSKPSRSGAIQGTGSATMPDPDPGESAPDIAMQIHGLDAPPPAPLPPWPASSIITCVRRRPGRAKPRHLPEAVMHGFTAAQVPVLSQLARAFGVSDRWFASAPCQTWPNRFFAHTGTAGGWVNNEPVHWIYPMRTIFRQLARRGRNWRVYFHDLPQSAVLCELWPSLPFHFRLFETEFARDAAAGHLPSYSFIEPRYFIDSDGSPPNDQHPPHDIAHGERLIAAVYNALRNGPGWARTLLLVTYDEHGGCYDHVPPPPATPPGGPYGDGFGFDRYGVRVPAVIVSPMSRPAASSGRRATRRSTMPRSSARSSACSIWGRR